MEMRDPGFDVVDANGDPAEGCAQGELLVERLDPRGPADDARADVHVEYKLVKLVSDRRHAAEGVTWRATRHPLASTGGFGQVSSDVAIKVIADRRFGPMVDEDRLIEHFRLMVDQFHAIRGERHPGLVTPHSVFLVSAKEAPHHWLRAVHERHTPLFHRAMLRPVAVTAWVAGVQLDRWNDGRSRGQRLEVLKPIAEAVDAMGHNGLSFRDIKPSNIIVKDGRGTLIDLGLIAPTDAEPNVGYGTPGFRDDDPLSTGVARDRFAFAALLLYQLLSVPNRPWPQDRNNRPNAGRRMFEFAQEALADARYPDPIVRLVRDQLHPSVGARLPRQPLSDLLERVIDAVGRPNDRRRGSR